MAKRRRRTRRTRLGSTAARFVEAKTEVMTPPRAGDMPAMRRSSTSDAAQEAVRLFTKIRSEPNCVAALNLFADGQRQLGRLVEFIEGGDKSTLMRFKDELFRAADASRAAQVTIAGRCFCKR
jgi:hypothetical protein